jgi:plastocyanin
MPHPASNMPWTWIWAHPIHGAPAASGRSLMFLFLLLCTSLAGAATLDVEVTDRNGKALAQAVVYLESDAARRLVKPAVEVEMAQEKRQFSPRVLVLPVGTEVKFPNRDSVRHHVYSFSRPKPFEIRLYSGVPANPVLFDQPGVVVLGCNIHDNMSAWIVVVETPYFALTGASGKAALQEVPPGAYRLRVWHADLVPGAAPLEQALTLPAAGATHVVRLALDAK